MGEDQSESASVTLLLEINMNLTLVSMEDDYTCHVCLSPESRPSLVW